ncbi:MAG: LbtU family siderophore porin [Desulfobulbales bacterium]|nr:LbtU family siderophore porin [Desulfobulbales bacterium]
MYKKICLSLALGISMVLFSAPESMALSPETELLLELLQAKGIITSRESQEFRRTLAASSSQEINGEEQNHRHSVQGLARRVEKLEDAREETSQLSERIHFGGFVEVEFSAAHSENMDGSDDTPSSVTLAAAQLDVDIDITDNVLGHVAFLYEDEEDFTVDEGFIAISNGEKPSMLFKAGKMYVPFGRYESHFVTDPATLILGETNDGALTAAFANDLFEVSAGVFNGAVDETGEDDRLDSFVGSIVYAMPANKKISVAAGVSYTSNLAASDTLQDDTSGNGVNSEEIHDLVGGFGAFLSASFAERFFMDVEYISALEDFTAGDLAFANSRDLKPSAWNVELAYALNSQVEFAARYGGSNDFGNVAPEGQYGIALLYSPFENTSITSEYIYAEFEDSSESNTGTIQLAIEY